MGANDQVEATTTEEVRATYSLHRSILMTEYRREQFDRWLKQVRAEAKAEALEDFAKVIDAEERDQWIADGIRKPGAQIVAQRMRVLGKVARARAEQIKAAP